MDKCKCWEEFKQIKGWYENKPMYIIVPICNGTKEREKCTCDGDITKCDFYPEYRNKKLMTKSEAEARFNIKIVGD